MPGDGLNRWIVLLNKSPKGPLSEEEIRALLAKSIVRRNDIAYLIPPPGDNKAQTEWKLLWQFPEFDRRGDESVTKKTEDISERRIEPVVDPRAKALTEIPIDLLNIAPEDLLPRSTGLGFNLDREPQEISETPVEPRPVLADFESTARNRWVFGSFGLVLVGVAVWIFYPTAGGQRTTASVPAPAIQERLPVSHSVPRSEMQVPGPSTPSGVPAVSRRTPEDAPLATRHEPEFLESDRGEVLEEDVIADENPDEAAELVREKFRAAKNPRDRPNMRARRQVESVRQPPLRPQNDEEGVDEAPPFSDPEVDMPPDSDE
jgi:hypothetical protein